VSQLPGPAVRLGVALWVVQPISLLVEIITAARVTAPYSFLDNTISDLGVTRCGTVEYRFGPVPVCSPWHDLMNASFIVFGVFLVVGALLLRRRLGSGFAGRVATGLWVVAGLGSVGTGLVPLDRDVDLHVLVSMPVLIAQPLAVLALGLAVRRSHPGLARSALVVGAVSVAGAVAFLARVDSPDLGGLFERLALWPGYLWLPAAALTLLRLRRAR
jgi:hypothetical membrane protein